MGCCFFVEITAAVQSRNYMSVHVVDTQESQSQKPQVQFLAFVSALEQSYDS